MKWIKKGLIFSPKGFAPWALNSALTPTPVLINEDTIRIYASFRDAFGVGRIGYVDVDANTPTIIKKISNKPVLDIGSDGMFDDNGMILGDVIRHNNEIRMYYVGFQLVSKVKFLAYSGMAVSRDGGDNFVRYSSAPILDRSDKGAYIRAIHSIKKIDKKYHIWYATGSSWQVINNIRYPVYNIRHMTSDDGIHFNGDGEICIDVQNLEYRIGRPRVFEIKNKFYMHYTRGTLDGQYFAGMAESSDGLSWKRIDNDLGISLSESGWDSKHLSYPALISVGDKIYMFYNGNDMGCDGFGYAELESF